MRKTLNGVNIQKVIYALKCQAVADALGHCFEFQSTPKAADLNALINSDSPIGITDDTQMTLFGFQAFLDFLKGPDDFRTAITTNYLQWYETQSGRPTKKLTTGLMNFDSLYKRRAPGGTCLSALRSLYMGNKVINTSTGCGTVMRGLPFVLQKSHKDYAWASSLTHKGVTIKATAVEHHKYMRSLLEGTPQELFKGLPFNAVFGNGGWSAKPCFQIAAWSLEHCEGDFKRLLHLSILHSGDSDSTGAMAGALYGLRFGPKDDKELDRLYNRLTEKDAIDYIINRLQEV